MERDEVDLPQLAVSADRLVGDGQRVARREALLLRPVARVRLDVLAEDLAHDGREQLVRGDRPETADRVAAERERPGGRDVDRSRRHGERMADADDAELRRRPGWTPRDQSKTPARSAASTSRDPSPADTETTRGTRAPSAARA